MKYTCLLVCISVLFLIAPVLSLVNHVRKTNEARLGNFASGKPLDEKNIESFSFDADRVIKRSPSIIDSDKLYRHTDIQNELNIEVNLRNRRDAEATNGSKSQEHDEYDSYEVVDGDFYLKKAPSFDRILETERYNEFMRTPQLPNIVGRLYGPENGGPSPLVNTTEGIIKGKQVQKYEVKYYSFEGIPFADVPERFKAPKPPKPWEGVKDATEEIGPCAQIHLVFGVFTGMEDCLYLNIHTPKLGDAGLPVMVVIHGGGFNLLMGTRYLYGPERFIKRNVIMVLINYRLGALGFLATLTEDAPGNAGMKDMVAALTWIQNNIKNFGGDPAKVTLFGSSSGAAAVEFLTLSKMAKGLFSKVIMQSGSAMNYMFYDSEPVKYALRLGNYLHIRTNSVKMLVERLKVESVEKLVEASQKLGEDILPIGVTRPFSVCTELPVPGEEMFLHDHPENILRSGDFARIPIMTGFNTMDGSEFIKGMLADSEFLNTIDNTFEYLLPPDLTNAMDRPQNRRALVDKVRQFYFKGERISNATAKEYVDMVGDSRLVHGQFNSISYRLQHSDEPIYFWELGYEGGLGLFRKYFSFSVEGVPHADETGYLFRVEYIDGYPITNKTEEVAQKLVALLSNFMKFGNPTPEKTNLLPVTWLPMEPNKPWKYMSITEEMEMKEDPQPFLKRVAFWNELFANKSNSV